jgi:tol-pal system protein YbgF
MASVRAMRAENARQESRLEKLEQQVAVGQSRAAPAAASTKTPTPAAAREELPALTVVKLKPKKDAAPRLATEVPVQEPPDAIVDELKATPDAAPDEAPAAIADQQYDRALDVLKTGDPEGGISRLLQFAINWPKHPRADNALYFAGLGMMALKDYEGAARTFDQGMTKYPAGDVVLDSMLKLAECRVKLNHPREAKATWEKIVTSFPGTAAATQAQARLASLPAASAATSP